METKASYVIVGGFVLTLVAGLFLFVLWLATKQFGTEFNTYHIYFRESVTGLQVGGLVRYRGIPVGSVTHIGIDPENVQEIQVTIEVEQNTPVREDTVASLEIQGLTGVAYVQLAGGTQGAPVLKPKANKKIAVIQSRESNLERVFASAPQLVDRLTLLADRATTALSNRNIQAITDTLDNIRTLTGAIAKKSDAIGSGIDEGVAAIRQLRETAASFDSLAKSLRPATIDTLESVKKLADDTDQRTSQLGPTMTQARHAAESFNRLANELVGVVDENRTPIKDFSTRGLYELTQFLTEARFMVESITRLANKIESDPARFLFGDQQQGVQAR
jgi:phospholipid/cholesterol/gamma-HCH transport system substrate-binding protein